MNALKNLLDKCAPTFSEGGKLGAFHSLFDAMETFFFAPNETAKAGHCAHIHDSNDSKRGMFMVVIALIPCFLFGSYNVGYWHYNELGQTPDFWWSLLYGLGCVLPKLVVSYLVGLGIEIAVAQWKKEEVHEGFFVTGFIIPLIVPVNCPLWILAIAVAFAVIFAKEVFGGTGMNIFNVALVTRAFLFFSYPSMMSGDKVWVNSSYLDCINGVSGTAVDAVTKATPLGEIATGALPTYSVCDSIIGLIPGSIGETSIIAIALGALLLLWTGVASWKTILSIFIGGGVMGLIFQDKMPEGFQWWHHYIYGGFAFGAVFMATDPVTSTRTDCGKWFYGFFIGVIAVLVRVLNPGYPEGMMLAILLMNVFAPLIDYCVVQTNINRRAKRIKA